MTVKWSNQIGNFFLSYDLDKQVTLYIRCLYCALGLKNTYNVDCVDVVLQNTLADTEVIRGRFGGSRVG